MGLIADRVAQAHAGTNPCVITRMKSGWACIGDVQFLPGYCVLLADPVVTSINDLSGPGRAQFLLDMVTLGDAILQVSGAYRINYEILGNSEPELHAHVFPRFLTEPEDQRRKPAWFYDWPSAVRFSPAAQGHLVEALRAALKAGPEA